MNMPRFAPYLGIVAALAVGILIAVFFGSTIVVRAPVTVVNIASSTPQVVSSTGTTTDQVIPVPKKITPSKNIATPAPVVSEHKVIAPVATTLSPSEENALLDISASTLRGALVNILCYVPTGNRLHSISGSGVIIDPKGIILTNAHVAQYFLLANRGVSCTIRSGSPASNNYYAALTYISPIWLEANPNVLMETAPGGTGEYDFAFLAITKSATTKALPSSFPYIPLATTPPAAGTPVVIASYGAQFLESNQIAFGLFPTIVFGSVKDIFTFAENTIDVLALGGSAAAQEGSSGGGVVDASGTLVGTITTSTVSGTTDTRSLDAITASYIRGEYASETGQAINLFLVKPTATSIADFAPQIPKLESIITVSLP